MFFIDKGTRFVTRPQEIPTINITPTIVINTPIKYVLDLEARTDDPKSSRVSGGAGCKKHTQNVLTLYLIQRPFNAFANRADQDQAALVRAA